MKYIVVLLVLACFAVSAAASTLEMVTNGDFEQLFSTGWGQNISGTLMYISRSTAFDPDPDYEARINCNNGDGSAKLWQSVIVPGADAEFSAKLASSAIDGGGAWCAAGLIVTYKDCLGAPLGRTALVSKSVTCPWTDGPTYHIINTTGTWKEFSFTLADELLNLPGVDASKVHELEVTLTVKASNC